MNRALFFAVLLWIIMISVIAADYANAETLRVCAIPQHRDQWTENLQLGKIASSDGRFHVPTHKCVTRQYRRGTIVVLHANPDPGRSFQGWIDQSWKSLSGRSILTVKLKTNRAVWGLFGQHDDDGISIYEGDDGALVGKLAGISDDGRILHMHAQKLGITYDIDRQTSKLAPRDNPEGTYWSGLNCTGYEYATTAHNHVYAHNLGRPYVTHWSQATEDSVYSAWSQSYLGQCYNFNDPLVIEGGYVSYIDPSKLFRVKGPSWNYPLKWRD